MPIAAGMQKRHILHEVVSARAQVPPQDHERPLLRGPCVKAVIDDDIKRRLVAKHISDLRWLCRVCGESLNPWVTDKLSNSLLVNIEAV